MIKMNVKADKSEIINYSYPHAPIYVNKAYLSEYPDFRAVSHWHEDIEFLLAEEGELNYSVNGNKVNVKEGDCIIVNSNNIHFGYSDEKKNVVSLAHCFHRFYFTIRILAKTVFRL